MLASTYLLLSVLTPGTASADKKASCPGPVPRRPRGVAKAFAHHRSCLCRDHDGRFLVSGWIREKQ